MVLIEGQGCVLEVGSGPSDASLDRAEVEGASIRFVAFHNEVDGTTMGGYVGCELTLGRPHDYVHSRAPVVDATFKGSYEYVGHHLVSDGVRAGVSHGRGIPGG